MRIDVGSSNFNRRLFISKLIAFLGLATLPDSLVATSHKTLEVFVEESGTLRAGCLCIGALFLENPHAQLAAVRELRKRYKFQRRLRRSNTSKFQIEFAAAMLDHFLTDPSVRFLCRVIPAPVDASQSHVQQLYNFHYRQLLSDVSRHGEHLRLTVTHHSLSHRDSFLYQYLQAEVPQIKNIQVVRIKTNDLLQVSGFFTGYVWADCQEPDPNLTNKAKKQIMSNFHLHCKTTSLSKQSFSYKGKFQVYVAG
jgi:hypothetical protein